MFSFSRLIIAIVTAFTVTSASAEQVTAGIWKQTSSNVGDCSNCEMKITRITPQIIQISGNNGWYGYLHYVQNEDRYRGALQWEGGKGGAYENVLFITDATYEGKTFSLNAKSSSLNMTMTYRNK